MRVVAISGYKRSGKDTVAKHLMENYRFKRAAFADRLKDMVATQYNIPREYMDNPKYKESPIVDYPVEVNDKFGEAIIDIMNDDLCWAEVKVDGINQMKRFWTPRALCILEGSIKRSVNSSYWVQSTIEEIDTISKLAGPVKNFVISDLRYRSEIKQLRDAFGDRLTTIRLKRFDKSPSSDPSETDLDGAGFDFIITNKNCNLDELYKKVDKVMSDLK